MPFSSLHTIELQLCFQYCNIQELLQFARCSRFTLAAASAPFTWAVLSRSAAAVTLSRSLLQLHSSSLLRFLDAITLRWRLDIPLEARRDIGPDVDLTSFAAAHMWDQPPVSDEEFSLLCSTLNQSKELHIVAFDASYRSGVNPLPWSRIFAECSEGMRSLQALTVHANHREEIHLESKVILHLLGCGVLSPATCPHLKSFEILHPARGFKLHRADFTVPDWNLWLSTTPLSEITALLRLEHLREIVSLHLQECFSNAISWGPAPAHYWIQAHLRNLSKLHTLTLDRTWGAQAAIKQVLIDCAALTRIVILAEDLMGNFFPAERMSRSSPQLPNPLGLQNALAEHHQLRISVQIPIDPERTRYNPL